LTGPDQPSSAEPLSPGPVGAADVHPTAPDAQPHAGDAPPHTPTPFATLLVRALLIKALFIALLVWAAESDTGNPDYQAPREGDANDVVWYLGRGFDARAYQRLASEGYTDDFSRNYPMGYPLLVRALDSVLDNTQVAAVLVSNLNAVFALGAFYLLARRYARRRGLAVDGALLVFATMPGWLTYGSVAYSESSWLVVAMFGWWAYLRAADGDGPRRHLGWLALSSLLAGAGVMVRHIAAPVFIALAVIEGWRLLRSQTSRGRWLAEAAAALWAGAPVAGYFLWKFQAHGLAELQQDIWQMHFSFLGGPASLVALGTAPEYLAQIYLSLPLVLLLAARLRRVDGRLVVICALALVLAYSFTGIAAQSITRYSWTLWPLALGALAIPDRGVQRALAGVLFCLSLWCGFGHVLGTAAL
jgi:hypothetical protein